MIDLPKISVSFPYVIQDIVVFIWYTQFMYVFMGGRMSYFVALGENIVNFPERWLMKFSHVYNR